MSFLANCIFCAVEGWSSERFSRGEEGKELASLLAKERVKAMREREPRT